MKKSKKPQRHRRPHEQSPQAKRTEDRPPTKPEVKERLEELREELAYLARTHGLTRDVACGHMFRVSAVMAGREV